MLSIPLTSSTVLGYLRYSRTHTQILQLNLDLTSKPNHRSQYHRQTPRIRATLRTASFAFSQHKPKAHTLPIVLRAPIAQFSLSSPVVRVGTQSSRLSLLHGTRNTSPHASEPHSTASMLRASGWVEGEVYGVDAVVSWKLNPKRFPRFIQVSRSLKKEAAGFSN